MSGGLPDILSTNLSVVFCGLNPGLRAAEEGHHFVGRGNRFWRGIHLAGFTPTQIDPTHDVSLLEFGCGVTTVVRRPTAGAGEVVSNEFRAGGVVLRERIEEYAPRNIAFLGKAAFAAIMQKREVSWGGQPDTFAGAAVWILPNPSGRNRSFSLADLIDAYSALRRGLRP
jgi:TDG/mug DNA glycosylase family protein